ncbi:MULTISPECIES: hypothetical protein [Priestia]|uniref:hypothetical protein n=1 Tax=Priestia TaxID=2800373 RepID=UPI0021D68E52|nr:MULTISPECIES: hypothetical protein [Priestia]MCU7712924.1 hypothetical protein [Priestia megaterium]MCW1048850.1 hypothetical protein [Priestia sp. JV24]MEB4861180.1 hypothetical protein [Priestia megaterium]
MKKYFIAIIMVMVFALGFYAFFHKIFRDDNSISISQNQKTFKSGDRKDAGVDTIEYGLNSLDGQYIDNGSVLTSENDEVNVNVSINHNLNEQREYGLIILEDFKQMPFSLGNQKKLSTYFFTMNPNSSKDILVKIPVKEHTKELTFLLIKKPSYKLKEMDLNRASILEDVLSMRYPVKPNKVDSLKEVKPNTVIKDGLNEQMFITDDKNKLQSVVVAKEGEKLLFSTGNNSNKSIRYAVIALKDWKQTKIIDDKEVVYTTVQKASRNLFDFTLPHVNKDSNFQLLAFPYPYQVSEDNYESQETFGSLRTVIEPNKRNN